MTASVAKKAAPAARFSFPKTKDLQKIVAPVVGIGLFLGVWQLLTLSADSIMPGPFEVITDT